MGGAASPSCVACGRTFAWEECYLARSTPGLAPPVGLGEWGGRTYCPGCGTVVTEWLRRGLAGGGGGRALGRSRRAAASAVGQLGVELAVERDDPDDGIRLCRRSTAIWPEACWQAHAVVALFLNANGDAPGGRKAR